MVHFRNLYSQETATIEQGKLCLFERGGAFTNTGLARLIGGEDGNPKTAIHIRTRGDLACGDHAAIPVTVGDHVIEVTRHHDNIIVSVGIVTDIDNEGTVHIQGAEADINHIEGLTDMVDAGIAKVYDYHCRRPYYIR